tara:strand:- start:264 stop:467 length:204 start_codon:yes stop_codon:yes gene_type:complete
MTRAEFNRTIKDTLLAMNMIEEDVDLEMDEDWDKEFSHMKHLTHAEFKDVCAIGIRKYLQVVNANNN